MRDGWNVCLWKENECESRNVCMWEEDECESRNVCERGMNVYDGRIMDFGLYGPSYHFQTLYFPADAW